VVVSDDTIQIILPKPPSLNAYYAGRHFMVRKKHKEVYWRHIAAALAPLGKFRLERFSIAVRYNCRYDVDNAICCSKFLADYLRNHGHVPDDTPKYYLSQETRFDGSLPKEQFLVSIIPHGQARVEQELLHGDVEDVERGDKPVRKPAQRKRRTKG
jgi:hypothetical protein